MPRPLFTHGKDPVPIVQEAGWAPGPVWTCAENVAPTGIRSPDRQIYIWNCINSNGEALQPDDNIVTVV
jgi:hypothetical protein